MNKLKAAVHIPAQRLDVARIILGGRAVPMEIRPGLSEVRCGDYFEGGAAGDYVSWTSSQGLFMVPPGTGGDCLAETLMRYHDEFMLIAARPERTGLPFPAARPAEPHLFEVRKLTAGLRRVKSQVAEVAMRDESGRDWAAGRGLADSASRREGLGGIAR